VLRVLLIAGVVGGLVVGLGLAVTRRHGSADGGIPGRRGAVVKPAVAGAVGVALPPGWHRLDPPITDVVYPTDRLLLTSYRAEPGGDCSPDRAEGELPAGGALIYLLEYAGRPGTAGNAFAPGDFPPRPAHFTLPRSALANYECWHVPSYLVRFSSAGRDFQVHVALGPGISPGGRRQVLGVLDSLRVSRRAGPKAPSTRRSVAPARPARRFTVRDLEAALRANPNRRARRAACAPATGADRREAERAFGRTRARLFACRLDLGGGSAELFDLMLMRNGCFVGERRRPGAADYGCIR
jgi:hypothetical protein